MISFADRAFQEFIRAIVANGESWGGRTGEKKRLNHFARLLRSDHRLIQEQAYLEVGRAPCAMIKEMAGHIHCKNRPMALVSAHSWVGVRTCFLMDYLSDPAVTVEGVSPSHR